MLLRRGIVSGSPILGYVYETFAPSVCFHQTFRWVRKPPWLPMAKSKIFRIPRPRNVPEKEKVEFMRLYNCYRTQMASIQQYCKEILESKQISLDEEHMQILEKEDFERCWVINEEWNQAIAKAREERRMIEKEERVIQVVEHMEKVDRQLEAERDAMEAKIRLAKEQSKTFITEKNIDEAIEKALSTITSYDKVLDLEGNFYAVRPAQNVQNKAAQ